MNQNTDSLIDRLTMEGARTGRLPSPLTRAMIWLAIAVPYAAAVTWFHGAGQPSTEALFLVEQLATLATAVAAAVAAFASTVPGYDRRILILPAAPLAVWLFAAGTGCIQVWFRDGFSIGADWDCLKPAIALGLVPLAAMLIMLRRGAPIRPRISLLLGALAAAAVANAALRLFHAEDAALVVLVWHLGVTAVLVGAASLAGGLVLNWRQLGLPARSHVPD